MALQAVEKVITAWTGQPCPPLDSITQPALMTQVGLPANRCLLEPAWNHLALVLKYSQHGKPRCYWPLGRNMCMGPSFQALLLCACTDG